MNVNNHVLRGILDGLGIENSNLMREAVGALAPSG